MLRKGWGPAFTDPHHHPSWKIRPARRQGRSTDCTQGSSFGISVYGERRGDKRL